jgi:hypothetical protein
MAFYRRRSYNRNYSSRRTSYRSYGGMSATKRATEAAFKRGLKSGMRKRGSNSRRAYFYR